nr:hypothetical protein Iba_chr07bCG6850 [Ipomoea batatas]
MFSSSSFLRREAKAVQAATLGVGVAGGNPSTMLYDGNNETPCSSQGLRRQKGSATILLVTLDGDRRSSATEPINGNSLSVLPSVRQWRSSMAALASPSSASVRPSSDSSGRSERLLFSGDDKLLGSKGASTVVLSPPCNRRPRNNGSTATGPRNEYKVIYHGRAPLPQPCTAGRTEVTRRRCSIDVGDARCLEEEDASFVLPMPYSPESSVRLLLRREGDWRPELSAEDSADHPLCVAARNVAQRKRPKPPVSRSSADGGERRRRQGRQGAPLLSTEGGEGRHTVDHARSQSRSSCRTSLSTVMPSLPRVATAEQRKLLRRLRRLPVARRRRRFEACRYPRSSPVRLCRWRRR